MASRRSGYKSRLENSSPPLDFLSKLFVEVRTPTEDDPNPADDFAWVWAENISKWNAGWHSLQVAGYVEFKVVETEEAEDFLGISHAVRFTQKGLDYALNANTTDGVARVVAEEQATSAANRNADKEGFGLF